MSPGRVLSEGSLPGHQVLFSISVLLMLPVIPVRAEAPVGSPVWRGGLCFRYWKVFRGSVLSLGVF